jgi:copper chaperone CopZ
LRFIILIAFALLAACGSSEEKAQTPASQVMLADVKLVINGMTCEGCVESITKGLQKQPAVTSVIVSLDSASAIIQYDATNTTTDALVEVVEKLGYQARVSP